MERTNYFKTDIRRLLKGYELYLAVIGVTAALFFSLEDSGIINNSVMFTYLLSCICSGSLISYIFCAFPYAYALGEDMENKYVRYQLIRGNLKKYVVSKISVIYLSSIVTMVAGSALFLVLVRTQVPWLDMWADDGEFFKGGQYSFLITNKHYFGYCLFNAFHMGLLAGTLSVLAAFVSLFVSNKVMVLAVPLLSYQILTVCLGRSKINLHSFEIYNKKFNNDIGYFLFVVMLSLVPVILLAAGSYKKIKKRL